MKPHRHRQHTKKRRKPFVKHLLEWLAALTAVLTLVKLLVEIVKMLH